MISLVHTSRCLNFPYDRNMYLCHELMKDLYISNRNKFVYIQKIELLVLIYKINVKKNIYFILIEYDIFSTRS